MINYLFIKELESRSRSWGAGAGAGEPEPELVDKCLIAPELEPELMNEYLIAPELEPELVLFYSGSPALLVIHVNISETTVISVIFLKIMKNYIIMTSKKTFPLSQKFYLA